MVSKKLTRAQVEKARYNLALKFTDDRTLARKARGWASEERWEQAFGNAFRSYKKKTEKPIPRKLPKRRKIYASKEEYNRIKRERYHALRRLGYKSFESSAFSTTYERYQKAIEMVKKKREKRDRDKAQQDPVYGKLAKRSQSEIDKRKAQWRKWASKDGKFPDRILDMVRMLNRKIPLPPNATFKEIPQDAGYGFGVIWYFYVYGGSLDGWIRKLQMDVFTPEQYTVANFRGLSSKK